MFSFSKEFRLTLFSFLFVAAVIMSNVIGGKISFVDLFGFEIVFSVGLIPFFFTFFLLDSINEVYGRNKTREIIWASAFALFFVFLVMLVSSALPFAERSWVKEGAFNSVFSTSIRMVVASLFAFILADLNDALVFSKLKEMAKGKFLWLRVNISNFVGQTLDTFVFMFLAFWNFFGFFSGYDAFFVVALALPYLSLKLVLSLVNTPFVYVGVKWLKGEW
ncbi:MAG: queuosine precursor transporter [Candidatus Diapherotrites archaeon]